MCGIGSLEIHIAVVPGDVTLELNPIAGARVDVLDQHRARRRAVTSPQLCSLRRRESGKADGVAIKTPPATPVSGAGERTDVVNYRGARRSAVALPQFGNRDGAIIGSGEKHGAVEINHADRVVV